VRCLGSGHPGRVSPDMADRYPQRGGGVDLTLAGVEGSVGHHCCRRGGPLAAGGRHHLRGVPLVGLRARRPAPGRGRGGLRAPFPTAEVLTDGDPRSDGRADRRPAGTAFEARPRRRSRHDRLAPRAPPPHPGVPGHDQPHPAAPRPGGAGAEEAPPLVLRALRRRATQRAVAGRLGARRPTNAPGDPSGEPPKRRPARDRDGTHIPVSHPRCVETACVVTCDGAPERVLALG
jgi:hypothetical protein